MQIEIDIKKRHVYIILAICAIIAGIAITNAVSPSVFGHTADEIAAGQFGGTEASDSDVWTFQGKIVAENIDPVNDLTIEGDVVINGNSLEIVHTSGASIKWEAQTAGATTNFVQTNTSG